MTELPPTAGFPVIPGLTAPLEAPTQAGAVPVATTEDAFLRLLRDRLDGLDAPAADGSTLPLAAIADGTGLPAFPLATFPLTPAGAGGRTERFGIPVPTRPGPIAPAFSQVAADTATAAAGPATPPAIELAAAERPQFDPSTALAPGSAASTGLETATARVAAGGRVELPASVVAEPPAGGDARVETAVPLTGASTVAPSAAPATAAPSTAAPLPPPTHPQFAQQVGQQVLTLARDGIGEARLNLNPADLGPLEVRISLGRDDAVVHFASHVGAVRDALEDALPRLREQFEQAGLRLGDSGVFAQMPERRDDAPQADAGSGGADPAAGTDADAAVSASSGGRRDLSALLDTYV